MKAANSKLAVYRDRRHIHSYSNSEQTELLACRSTISYRKFTSYNYDSNESEIDYLASCSDKKYGRKGEILSLIRVADNYKYKQLFSRFINDDPKADAILNGELMKDFYKEECEELKKIIEKINSVEDTITFRLQLLDYCKEFDLSPTLAEGREKKIFIQDSYIKNLRNGFDDDIKSMENFMKKCLP